MKYSTIIAVLATVASLVPQTVARPFEMNMAYTYSNATLFMPAESPIMTFLFDLPIFSTFEQGPSPLSNEIGMEKGSCHANGETGLVVCNNIVQVFDDGQLMLQGTGHMDIDCTLHAVVGGTGVYTGVYGSANECDEGNDVVSFTYDLRVEGNAASVRGLAAFVWFLSTMASL